LPVTARLLVEAKNLCVERSGASILHDINLEVDHGEVVALLGANGSGKSTLLHALVGLIPISAGSVELCAGHDGQTGIALVPQFAPPVSLIPLTVFELVATGLTTKRSVLGLTRKQRGQIRNAIDQVGLNSKSTEGVDEILKTLEAGKQMAAQFGLIEQLEKTKQKATETLEELPAQ
jgi:zinc transport system ATP-binding protein